ncbi:MAG: carboxypeptidase regulatory-like domain-containing protein, partial [Bacteroidales bacterium]|nr:carboxypeptidase regulatory-like domain-containing protein [Bacteroidales bacterium]
MYKKLIMALASLMCGVSLLAQTPTGGVKGTIVSRTDNEGIENATLTVYQGAVELATAVSDADGNFQITGLANGLYEMKVVATDYLETMVNFAVEAGLIKNMFKLRLSRVKDEASDELFEEFDMDDSGYSDNPTVLFGQNDVFNNIAGYNFS